MNEIVRRATVDAIVSHRNHALDLYDQAYTALLAARQAIMDARVAAQAASRAGDATRNEPSLRGGVPTPARCAYHRPQFSFVVVDPDPYDLVRPRLDGGLVHQQFHGGVPELALAVRPVSNADEALAKLQRQLPRSRLVGRKLLQDPEVLTFGH